MKLTRHSDYALRALVYLGLHRGELVTTAEVATAYDISRHHLHKVVADLGRLGVIEVRRGVGGGMRLAHEPEDISLGHVVRELEVGAPLVECFDSARDQCVISPACTIHGTLARALEAFFEVLDEVSLASVLAGGLHSALGALLPRPERDPAD